MEVVQNRSSVMPVNGSLSLAVKNKQPIYISEKDPRALNLEYLKSHPGQIIILSESDFAKWLKQEYNTGTDLSSLNDNESPTLYSQTIDKSIGVPGIPTWNKSDIRYVATDSGSLENITITFNPSPTDPGDGVYTYHVSYEPGTLTTVDTTSPTTTPVVVGPTTLNIPITGSGSSGTPTTSQPTASVINTPVGTITTLNNGPSYFKVQWKAIPHAISYTVTASGNNLPYASPTSGTCSYVVSSKGGRAGTITQAIGTFVVPSGMYTFQLNNNGTAFSGSHSVTVQVNYAKGSSVGVYYAV